MGKKKRFQVHEDYGEPKTQEERKLSQIVTDKISDKYAEKVAAVRSTQFSRWREICGVGPDDPIDWDNPYVHLEWMLCDFKTQMKLMTKDRDQVVESMDDMQR